jgi:hypothetical protein
MIGGLFYVSAYLFMILLIIKVVIHISLDNSMRNKIVLSPMSKWVYLLPYDKLVDVELEQKKRTCNRIQKLMMYALFSTFLFAILKIVISWFCNTSNLR